MSHVVLMLHALTGMMFILAAVWVFVDVLNVGEGNIKRIRNVSWLATLMMWLTIFLGGYWYVLYFYKDKAVILKGPWPFSHTFFMETKEHIIFMLLLLATLLPVIASNDLLASKPARKLMLWVCAIIVVVGIGMEGSGGIISMGAKLGLLPASY
jgi:hypothetical protein